DVLLRSIDWPPLSSPLFPYTTLFRSGLDPDRVRVLPNFTFDPGQRPTPPSVSDTVLFVGRLSTEKGVETLIQAWESEPRSLRLVDRKSTRLNSSHVKISYAVFCLKKK